MQKWAGKKIFCLLINRKGFTLVELIFTVVIMSVALIPILNLFSTSHENMMAARKIDVATNLAQMKLEELKDASYHEVNPVTDKTEFAGFPGYSYIVAVTENNSTSKTVTVTVYFKSLDGESSISLTMEKVRR